MSLAPEQRVNMSLDDLIKVSQKKNKSKTVKVGTPASAASVRTSPPFVIASMMYVIQAGSRKNKNKKSQAPVQKQQAKVAVKAAAGKAKRGVAVNQRRGIIPATAVNPVEVQKQIDAAVKKAVKAALQQQKPGTPKQMPVSRPGSGASKKGNNRRAPKVPTVRGKPVATGLKISFNPKDLNKTTEKNVAQQIKGVLSRTVNVKGGAGGGQRKR